MTTISWLLSFDFLVFVRTYKCNYSITQRLSSKVETKTAGERLTTIASWLMGTAMVLIALSIEVLAPGTRVGPAYAAVLEAGTLTLLVTSLVMFSLAATCLCAPYYETTSVGTLTEVEAMKFSRRLLIVGTVFIFWALGFLMMISFEFQPEGVLLAALCIGASFTWLLLRKGLAKAPF